MSTQTHEEAGAEPGKSRAPVIHFTVDGEPFETAQRPGIVG